MQSVRSCVSGLAICHPKEFQRFYQQRPDKRGRCVSYYFMIRHLMLLINARSIGEATSCVLMKYTSIDGFHTGST